MTAQFVVALPIPSDVPSFVPWTVSVYDGAIAHVVGVSTCVGVSGGEKGVSQAPKRC